MSMTPKISYIKMTIHNILYINMYFGLHAINQTFRRTLRLNYI